MGMKIAEGCDNTTMQQLQSMLQQCNPYVQQIKHNRDVVKTLDGVTGSL